MRTPLLLCLFLLPTFLLAQGPLNAADYIQAGKEARRAGNYEVAIQQFDAAFALFSKEEDENGKAEALFHKGGAHLRN